jgi:hypothetical protein
VTPIRCLKSQIIFTLPGIHTTVINGETYRTQIHVVTFGYTARSHQDAKVSIISEYAPRRSISAFSTAATVTRDIETAAPSRHVKDEATY